MSSKTNDRIISEEHDVESGIDKWGYSMLVGVIALAWADELRLSATVSFALGFVLAFLAIVLIEVVAARSEPKERGHDRRAG